MIRILLLWVLMLSSISNASYIQGASSGGGGGGQNNQRVNAGECSGTKTLDFSTYVYNAVDITGNCTLVFGGIDPQGGVYEVELAEGGHTITWPTNVKWSSVSGNFTPSNSGKTDLVTLVYNGTYFMGSPVYGFILSPFSNVNSINWGAANASKSLDLGTSFGYEHSQPFTMSAWVNVTGTVGYQRIFDNQDSTDDYVGYTLTTIAATNTLAFQVVATNGTNRTGSTAASVPADGNYHNVTVTWDGGGGSSGVARIYIDGSYVTTTMSGTASASAVSTAHMFHGKAADSSNYLKGNSDEPAIYNVKLSDGEVLSDIWNAGKPSDLATSTHAANLQGWWRNGDPADDLTIPGGILDRSGNGRNATCSNCTGAELSTNVP